MPEPDHDLEKRVRVYRRIRDAKLALSKKFKAEEKVLNEKLELVSNDMLRILNETRQDSARTSDGTVYKQKDILPRATEWLSFYEWIKLKNAFDFLERRIKKTAVKQYMEDNEGALPPGVAVLETIVIRVRKDGEKDEE
jgi:hypothetical protein